MANLNKNIDTNKISGIVLLVLLIVGGFVYWNYQKSDTEQAPPQQIFETVTPTIPDTTEGLQVVSTSESTGNGVRFIYAEVKNTGQRKTGVSLTATIYDSAGKVIGTSPGAVENIETGETKTATFYIAQPNQQSYATYKVDIDGAY